MLNEFISRFPMLSTCTEDIEAAADMLCSCFKSGGKLLVCGNGGSASDSTHIVGELMKGFLLKRCLSNTQKNKFAEMFEDGEKIAENLQGALPAIALTEASALSTAFLNDVCPDTVFAQQVWGLGLPLDTLLCISTSGNSKNVVAAAKTAKVLGLRVISLTGEKESALSEISDITIRVPETETFKVQELHLPVYHYICAKCEKEFFEVK